MQCVNRVSRFLTWLLLTATLIITHFHRVNLNVLSDHLMVEFKLSGTSLGNLAAIYSYMFIIMQIPGGAIIDRFGPRRVSFVASFLMGAGTILFGCAHSITGIFAGRLLIGIGASVVLLYVIKFQSSWYSPNEFATMTGLAIFVGGMGFLLGTFPLAYMVTLTRWQSSFIAVGLISIILSILCLLFVRDFPEKKETNRDNFAKCISDNHYTLWYIMVLTVKNKQLWVPFLVYFGIYGSFITLTGAWGTIYMMQVYHISRPLAALAIFPASLGAIFGAPISGYLYDRLKCREKIIVIASLIFFVNWALLVIYRGKPPLSLMYFIAFNLGLTASSTNLNLTYAKKISQPNMAASSVAFVNAGLFTGAAILQPSFGYILQRGWEGILHEGVMVYPISAYVRGFILCWLISGISMVLSLYMSRKKDCISYSKRGLYGSTKT